MDFPVQVQRCIYTTNWIERLNRKYKRTIKNENINAIKQVATFPTSKCCNGRNKNNIFKENLSMEILETQEKKMNKNKENKREITNFLGHYHRPSTEVYMYDQLG